MYQKVRCKVAAVHFDDCSRM